MAVTALKIAEVLIPDMDEVLQGVAPQAVAHVAPLPLSTQPKVFGVVVVVVTVVVVTVVVVTVVVVNGLLTPQPVALQQHSRDWKM